MDKLKFIPKSLIMEHELIDFDHNNLFSLFDKVSKIIKKKENIDELDNIIEELVNYTSVHFENEEKLMSTANYPYFKQHRLKHKMMLAHVHGYLVRFNSENESKRNIAVDINDFIKSWLEIHIEMEDMYLGNYLNKL
ncbi:MAG: hemerythrin family protein [Magnetococcales bacterium]|nr:hemerythrin family protein [Magnetococcales bacterium]